MRFILTPLLLIMLTACQSNPPWRVQLQADFETQAVNQSGDAADDPALWVHSRDPEQSLIIGTQKKQGLYTYTLEGEIKQFIPAGRLNNVDIRQGVQVGPDLKDVVAASNRSNNSISLFLMSRDRQLKPWKGVSVEPSAFSEVYGFCMGQLDQTLVFVMTGKNGDAELYELTQTNKAENSWQLKRTRKLVIPSQSEGCVIDDKTGDIYIGEEAAGVWQFNYWDQQVARIIIPTDGQKLVADVEGLALIRDSDKTYLMVSSQGNDQFPIYDLADHAHVVSIQITGNALADRVSGTDGIDVNQLIRTPTYPDGVFMAQDDRNTSPRANQNFKIVSLTPVLDAIKQ